MHQEMFDRLRLVCGRCGVEINEDAHGLMVDKQGRVLCLADVACASRVLAIAIAQAAARLSGKVTDIRGDA
jgi:hypothetical protein